MIKNEKQYRVTKRKLNILHQKITDFRNEEDLSITKQLLFASLLEVSNGMENEVAEYELLKTNKARILSSRSISELPSLITEYKIASGMTQKEFSKKIGMKEQQFQRYEAENFQGISFKNLIKILNAMGLDITITNTRVRQTSKRDLAETD
ncbi:MAG TPA: helix-turn-helix transcriptional regulator [Puia sp.]|jgi:HTH-type transcriptional regulator/antitoxin HigA